MTRRILGFVAVAGVLIGAAGLVPFVHASTAAADSSFPAVTVNPTTQITDGQAVTVTVKTNADAPTYAAEAHLCRGGIDYQGSTDRRPNADAEGDGPNCPGPSHPVSSSSDATVVDSGVHDGAPTPDGEPFLFRVGAGVVNWTDGAGTARSLTCNETHSCDLVVEVRFSPTTGADAQWKPFAFPISYGTNDPIAGCGGPATGALATGAGDRMQDSWIAWTLGACAAHPTTHAPTRSSFVGESEAVASFATGTLDLAYTAGGYDNAMALLPKGTTPRAAIPVPIALNATTVAVGGGRRVGTHKSPYKTIQLTAPEIAGLVGGGVTGVTPYRQAILERNPELGQTDLFDTSAGFAVGAYADGEASSWYGTRWLKTLAPNAWKVPDANQFGADRGRARGIDASLALADPGYTGALTLLSGRPALLKGLIGPNQSTEGGVWVLTDLATASAVGLTPVQTQDPAGNFVAPTPESLRAAVPGMKVDDAGILISDPTNTVAQGGVQPYAMTFVEYALAPAEPLLNDDCTPRTASQKLLTDWLTYITGDGQAKLPSGMVPLPDTLKAEAAAQLKKVGAAKATGTCAEKPAAQDQGSQVAAPSTPEAPAVDALAAPTTPAEIASSFLAGSPSSVPAVAPLLASLLGVSKPTELGAAAVSPPTPDSPRTLVQELAAIPPYVAARTPAWIVTALALIGIIGLLTLALRFTSRST